MMNRLRNNHELNRKMKTEIIALLGKPESKTETEFDYYLGMAKHGIDTGHLTIYFDQNKKILNIKIYRG